MCRDYTISGALWNVTYYKSQWTRGLSSGPWLPRHRAVLGSAAERVLRSDGPSLSISTSCVTLGKLLNLSGPSPQNSS